MVNLRDWSGLARGRRDDSDGPYVRAIISSPNRSFASPFQVLASDGRRYFVKALGGCQEFARGSLAIEYVVAEVGRLIGAPICENVLIRIPGDFADWPMPFGKLQPGIAHASAAIEVAVEQRRALRHRMQDDNSRRQVGIYALYDWCFGDDAQWLHDVNNDRAIYSHDHGLYLPPHDGSVRADLLQLCADEPNALHDPPDGLDAQAIKSVSDALERIDRDALVKVVRGVPASWPVIDDDLEALGWFLEHRASAVAARLRALI